MKFKTVTVLFFILSYTALSAGKIPPSLEQKWNNSILLSSINNLKNAGDEFDNINEKYKKGEFREIVSRYPFKAYLYCMASNLPMPDFSLNPLYREFFASAEFNRVSIIFVAHQVHIPASMFGHTFASFKNGDRISPLDTSIDFMGVTENERHYALKSLFYHIPGRYKLKRFIEKVNEYDREDRDLWEYELAVPVDTVFEMKLLAAEISGGSYSYNFLVDNCSDYILSFFGVWPELKIDKRSPVTIPLETVKILESDCRLIRKKGLYPSRYTRAFSSFSRLTPPERDEFNRIRIKIDNGERVSDPASPVVDKAVSAYLNYKIKEEGNYYIRENAVELKKSYHAADYEPVLTEQPLDSHSPLRIDFSYGSAEGGADYYFLGIRPAMHSACDPLTGYQRNTTIEAFSAEMALEGGERDFYLSGFSLVTIDSFIPGNMLSEQFTRYISISYEDRRAVEDECAEKAYAKLGSGFSCALFEKLVLSVGVHAGAIDYLDDDGDATWIAGTRPRIYLNMKRLTCDLLLTAEYDMRKGRAWSLSSDINYSFSKNFSAYVNYELGKSGYCLSPGVRFYY